MTAATPPAAGRSTNDIFAFRTGDELAGTRIRQSVARELAPIVFARSRKPGGVRIGTAEIYRVVEQFDEVLDSLVVGLTVGGDIQVALFVVLREGAFLTADLEAGLKARIRTEALESRSQCPMASTVASSSSSRSKTSMSASRLKRMAMPSCMGFAAWGPTLPSPGTAEPSVNTPTRSPASMGRSSTSWPKPRQSTR
mgnify:CR=1 FL=1